MLFSLFKFGLSNCFYIFTLFFPRRTWENLQPVFKPRRGKLWTLTFKVLWNKRYKFQNFWVLRLCNFVKVQAWTIERVLVIKMHLVIYSTFTLYLLQVLQLQRQLRDQCVTRRALEKALSHWPLSYDATKENSIPEVSSLCKMSTSYDACHIL